MYRKIATCNQTLSFARKSELTNAAVNSSKQAIRIRSGVAGLSSGNHSLHPTSALAAIMASLMAKKTADAKKNGGSPTALDEWMAFTFGCPYQIAKRTQTGQHCYFRFKNESSTYARKPKLIPFLKTQIISKLTKDGAL